jgi:hypothetical protein
MNRPRTTRPVRTFRQWPDPQTETSPWLEDVSALVARRGVIGGMR